MKKLLLCIALSTGVAHIPGHAQSTGDLIQQLLLDVRKLDDLKVILQDMKKSYDILDKGYTEIRDLARGRFQLHKLFLDALLAVSPSVRDYDRIRSILDAEFQLVKEYRNAQRQTHTSGLFTQQELGYFDGIYAAVYDHSLQSLDELTMVITDGQLRMSDAQRLRSIDRVYRDISGQLRAARQLNGDAALQAAQRQKEKNDLNTLKILYGNP